MSKIIISGEAYGFGSDKWRGVKGLSSEAKEALKNDSALVITERPFDDHYGPWYVVEYNNGYYNHRLPNDEQQKLIDNM